MGFDPLFLPVILFSYLKDSSSRIQITNVRLFISLDLHFQEASGAYLATALESGLLPFLYNVAWVLESSVIRYQDQLLRLGYSKSGLHFVVPLVTTLSRLLARVTHAILNNLAPDQNPSTSPSDLSFAVLTMFIRHLCVLSPGHTPNESITVKNRGEIWSLVKSF